MSRCAGVVQVQLRPPSKTDENLETAINGEARARLKYTAFALQAMEEGHPEIAQLFLEAAGPRRYTA